MKFQEILANHSFFKCRIILKSLLPVIKISNYFLRGGGISSHPLRLHTFNFKRLLQQPKMSETTTTLTRMWANAQRDGRPAKYRWCPVLNAAEFGWRPLLKCRAVTLPKYESARLGGCKVNFARGKIPSGGKRSRKCIYGVPGQETAKHSAKFGWLTLSDVAAVTKPKRETRWN